MQRNVSLVIAISLLGATAITHARSTVTPFTGFYAGVNAGVVQTYGTTNSSAAANNIHVMGFTNPLEVQDLSHSQHHNLQNNSFLGGLNVGYGHQFCVYNLYLGAEIFATLADRSNTVSNRSLLTDVNPIELPVAFDIVNLNSNTKTNLNNFEWGIDLRPGVVIAHTLVYARVGVAFNNININNNNRLSVTYPAAGLITLVTTPLVSNVSSSRNKNVAAWRLGLGLEEYLCNNLAVTVDYVYTYYGSVSTSGTGSVKSNATLRTDGQFQIFNFTTPNSLFGSAKSTLYNQQIYLGLKYYF